MFETKHGRWVCRYAAGPDHPYHEAVFVDAISKTKGWEGTASGIGFCGPNAHFRCLRELGNPVGRMRINGAWKLYKREQRASAMLRSEITRMQTSRWWRLGRFLRVV